MQANTSIRDGWDKLGPTDLALLVDTSVSPAVPFRGLDAHPFHEAFYDLRMTEGSTTQVAEFVREGLPPQFYFESDPGFIHRCNWPTGCGYDGAARLRLDAAGLSQLAEKHDLRIGSEAFGLDSPALRSVLEEEGCYLPEATCEGEGHLLYDLPLNMDVALRLMRRNQERFRLLFDTLLLELDDDELGQRYPGGPDELHKRFCQAVNELDATIMPLMGLDPGQLAGTSSSRFRPRLTAVMVMQYVPNSVTWAWVRLLEAVEGNSTYRRCARGRCGSIFAKGRPDQKYCSPKCRDAERHLQLRKAASAKD